MRAATETIITRRPKLDSGELDRSLEDIGYRTWSDLVRDQEIV